VFGTLGLAAAVTGFGLSTTFVSLAIFRCLQGVFNGNIGITKAVLAEITDSSNVARGESALRVVYAVLSGLIHSFQSILFDSNDMGTGCYYCVSDIHVPCEYLC
jgi:hypothetical protein